MWFDVAKSPNSKVKSDLDDRLLLYFFAGLSCIWVIFLLVKFKRDSTLVKTILCNENMRLEFIQSCWTIKLQTQSFKNFTILYFSKLNKICKKFSILCFLFTILIKTWKLLDSNFPNCVGTLTRPHIPGIGFFLVFLLITKDLHVYW